MRLSIKKSMDKEGRVIFALSTPKSRSAICVFRVSGKGSHKIIKKISSQKRMSPNQSKINYLYDEKGKKIDKTLTTFFKSPKTYTGEDMVELSCHGSLAVINKISETFIKIGLRPANPGEFTKRALLNDKMDTTQAESISDIVNSETEKQRIMALKNLDGALSGFLKKISNKIMKMLADIEACIDFSEEELPQNTFKEIKEQNKNIIKQIKNQLEISKKYKPILEGFAVSVIGKPNTGKSSFINFLAGRDVSIVTNIPGTTTDSLEAIIDINGYKFKFIDTAGIRRYKNKIEKIGIEKTYKTVKKSDLNIVFLEKNEKKTYKNIANKIFVRSKEDIRKSKVNDNKIIRISSTTGFGIKKLISKIEKKLAVSDSEKIPMFSRERHIQKINNCLNILESIDFNSNIDIIAHDIRLALRNTQEIYQKFDIEKILDIIFSDFCIGK